MDLTTITYDDFAKVDIRMGTIVAAEIPEGSRSLVKLTVDFGEELGKRTIFSGIKQWYTPENLIGVQTSFVVNLAPKKMGDLGESCGMLLAVSGVDEDGGEKPLLFSISQAVPNGTRLH